MIQFHLSWFIYFSMDIVFTTRYLLYESHTILSTGSIVSSHNAKLASDAILLQFIYLFISDIYAGWPSSASNWFEWGPA